MMKRAPMKTLLLTVIGAGLAVTISCDTVFGTNGNGNDAGSDDPNLAGRWVGAAFGHDHEGDTGQSAVFRLNDAGYGCSCFGTITDVDGQTLSTELRHKADEDDHDGDRFIIESFPEGDWKWENPPDDDDPGRSTHGSYVVASEPTTLQDELAGETYSVSDSEMGFTEIEFHQDAQRFTLTNGNSTPVEGDYFSAKKGGLEVVGLFPDNDSFVGSFHRREEGDTLSLHGWAFPCE